MRTPAAIVAALVLLLTGGCSQTSQPAGAPPAHHGGKDLTPSLSEPCALSRKLVPTCGILLGVTAPEPTYDSYLSAGAAVGRRFRMLYRFHDINDRIPDAEDRAIVSSGAILRLTIEARNYASPDRTGVTWADVAAGKFDVFLRRQARGIAALDRPVLLTFSHEPDQPGREALGTPAQYVSAWRHVHDLFERMGARRVVWVWNVMGWPKTFERALAMWPGNNYVDWIGWDAYNKAGCTEGDFRPGQWRTFEQAAIPFYRWLWTHGPSRGVDTSKPMMLSEVGSVANPNDAHAVDRWYAAIPAVLQQFPQIKAVTIWDHRGRSPGCDFRFSSDPQEAEAVSKLVHDAYLTRSGGQ
jgi:hypothetical protein